MAHLIAPEQAAAFERCIEAGGIVVFPADTVYGLACNVDDEDAVDRLYELKGRDQHKPAAVMFFSVAQALESVGRQGPRTLAVLEALLPGPVTLLLPDSDQRYPLASAGGESSLGVRVPALAPAAAALHAVRTPVLQSSANSSGGADASDLMQVPTDILDGADMVFDAGHLPGTPSTVLDLRGFEDDGSWSIVRDGAMAAEEIQTALEPRR